MVFEKGRGYVHIALGKILGIMVKNIPEERIVEEYHKYFAEGMKNLYGDLRKNFQQYLINSKDSKLEKIAVLMERDMVLN